MIKKKNDSEVFYASELQKQRDMSGLCADRLRGTQINKFGQLCFRNNIGALKKAPSVSDGLENFSNTDENAMIGEQEPSNCKIDQDIQIFTNPMSIPTEQSSIQKPNATFDQFSTEQTLKILSQVRPPSPRIIQ